MNEKEYLKAIAFVEVNQFDDPRSEIGKMVKRLAKKIEKYEKEMEHA